MALWGRGAAHGAPFVESRRGPRHFFSIRQRPFGSSMRSPPGRRRRVRILERPPGRLRLRRGNQPARASKVPAKCRSRPLPQMPCRRRTHRPPARNVGPDCWPRTPPAPPMKRPRDDVRVAEPGGIPIWSRVFQPPVLIAVHQPVRTVGTWRPRSPRLTCRIRPRRPGAAPPRAFANTRTPGRLFSSRSACSSGLFRDRPGTGLAVCRTGCRRSCPCLRPRPRKRPPGPKNCLDSRHRQLHRDSKPNIEVLDQPRHCAPFARRAGLRILGLSPSEKAPSKNRVPVSEPLCLMTIEWPAAANWPRVAKGRRGNVGLLHRFVPQ